MIYAIRHTTRYVYEAPVSSARHMLRLWPRRELRQDVLDWRVHVRPRPAERVERPDFFGNPTDAVLIEHAHEALVIEAHGRIRLRAPALVDAAATPAWETMLDTTMAMRLAGPDAPVHFAFPSRKVPIDEAIRAYAVPSFPAGRPVLACARDLVRRIHEDFTYEPGSTDTSTNARQALDRRAGVCQDFAHVAIGCLRSLGVPAAYVGGYLRTYPPPGRPRLVGADAMHAWISVWCGEAAGWVDMDPTNDTLTRLDHIVTGRGRDFGDISPIDGVILGGGDHVLKVGVDVEPLVA